ncbi:MAG: hypothetical protein KJO54_11465, partial [Gammaproteobacteria bacterium]|nr:hypothetical protein [Gammaproteobacteria bacterium]
MSVTVRIVMLTLVLAVPGAGVLAAEQTPPAGLQLDYSLDERSLEKIADGSAAQGISRLDAEPDVVTAPGTPIALLLAGLVLAAAAAFAGGFWLARRMAAQPAADAPVALWLDAEQLQADLQQRDGEIEEQQRSYAELAAEREQLLLSHADELHELRGEKEELQRELNALRLRGSHGGDGDDAQATIDSLREELARLQSTDDDAVDLRELPSAAADTAELRAELVSQKEHIQHLEALLQEAHDESAAAEQRLVRLGTLEQALEDREHELREATGELSRLREKAEQFDQQENRVAVLDSELSSLRDEMNELLGKTGQYQVLVPELENKLFHRQEQIGALESDLHATADEIAERDRATRHLEETIQSLQVAATESADRIASLESDLQSALAENELVRLDPDTEELHQENIRLRARVEELEQEITGSKAALDEVNLHRERLDEWNSTVTSLQAEIRRKSTLIDSQADHLAEREKLVAELRGQIEDLRVQLTSRQDESESLRGLLEQAGNVVVSLRDEIGHDEHAATRLRLARDPAQDPFAEEGPANPVEADIEALRFTSRSRRDLGNSLENILAEERAALEQASRRIREHDEEVTTLKNDISANRVAMVALRTRLEEAEGSGSHQASAREPARIEQELQQSMKVLEALRADLHKWRGRVRPLHDALLARNERIQYLEAELAALRQAQGLEKPQDESDPVVDDVSALLRREQNGESPEAERARCLDEMKNEWDRIVALETELAETGARLARVLELDDSRCRQIESLE